MLGTCLKDYEEAQKKGTISEEIHGRFLELPLVVRRLVDMRISSYNATRSAFSFDKLFKELCRAGLPICDVDQVFSDTAAQMLSGSAA